MIGFILKKVLGSRNARVIKAFQPQVEKINSYESTFEKLSDDELRSKTVTLKLSLVSG